MCLRLPAAMILPSVLLLMLALAVADPGLADGRLAAGKAGPRVAQGQTGSRAAPGRSASPVAPSDPPASVLPSEVAIPADAPGRLGRGGTVSYPSKWNGKVHVRQKGRVRSLYLGRRMDIVHTRLDLDKPTHLISPYQRCLLAAFGYLEKAGEEIRRVAMIGLGGGAMTLFFHEKRPQWVFHSVEIDPVVVAVARAYFGVKDTPSYRSYAMDGRRFLEEAKVPYDLIILDAFNAEADVPKTLASQEFFRLVRQRLTSRGLLVLNVLVHSPRVYASIVKTLGSVFPVVARMPLTRFRSRNSLLIASADPAVDVELATLRTKARQVEARWGVGLGLERCIGALGSDRVSLVRAPLIRDPPAKDATRPALDGPAQGGRR